MQHCGFLHAHVPCPVIYGLAIHSILLFAVNGTLKPRLDAKSSPRVRDEVRGQREAANKMLVQCNSDVQLF